MTGQASFDFSRSPYPNGLPGYKEDGASKDMAEKIDPQAKIDRERVYRVLLQAGPSGMTGSEIEAATGIPLLNVRPRLTDLKGSKDGKIPALIRKTAERRQNAKGNSETVWCAI